MARANFHPSTEDLLRYADGELGDRQTAKIRRHLASCWDCRTRLAQVEGTIVEFVNLRRRALDLQINRSDFPSVRASRALLSARLSAAAASSRPGPWRFLRPAWIGGAAAVLLIALLIAPTVFPPHVSAKEVIANVEAAEKHPSAAAMIHQRVRVRAKGKSDISEASADYDVWTSTQRTRLMPASLRPGPVRALQSVYESHGASWDRPLSIQSYVKLRTSLGQAREEVSGRELLTLTSTPASPGSEIQRMELTVRKSGWHALALRILLADAEYEITELLHEIVPPASVDSAWLGEPAPTPRNPAVSTRIAEPELASAVTAPSDGELEDAEVRLREALHATGSDIREVYEIERRPGEIHLRLWTQTTLRKDEILAALAGVSYVSSEIYDAEAAPGDPPPVAAAKQLYSTRPPLAEALRKYLGGIDPANRYLDEVRDSYLRVLLDASALQRLAHRYPFGQWKRLPAGLQNRLNGLAADHVRAIRANAGGYQTAVSLSLDEMLRANNQKAMEVSGPAGCDSWQEVTPRLVANLRGLQAAFWRLFVEERVETPVDLPAPDLLREAAQARSELMKEFNRLCSD